MSNSIQVRPDGGASFTGPKAVEVFQATAVRVALDHYKPGFPLMHRTYTLSNMLAYATARTGKQYARGAAGARKAAKDLSVWIADRRREIAAENA